MSIDERSDVRMNEPAIPSGFPMERNMGLLTDTASRPRVLRRDAAKRFPFPIPNGWFIVACADDLGPGDVIPAYYFGRHLVIYRADDGTAHVLDAHCPHLGAHLGVGGRVEGDCIRCPFHGWLLDGESGQCVEVPYDDVAFIPPRARARSYPTLERNGMIWAWHHLQGKEPFYDVPVVAEFDDPDWLPIVVREFPIATCCQEMAENNYDTVHFQFVHGSESIPAQDDVIDGYYKRSTSENGAFVREGFGLGLGVLRMQGMTTFLSSTTPIDDENILVRWIFTAPHELGDDAAESAADLFCAGVSQDIPIWENKIYQDPPVLRPLEKPISEHRRWCQQFYSYPEG